MKQTNLWVMGVLALCACRTETEGIGSGSGASSESSSGEAGDDATTVADPSGDAVDTTAVPGESSGEATTESGSTDDSGSDSGSTGVEVHNYALSFDSGLAISESTTRVNFDGAAYTIEMWILADNTMQGVLFDTTVADFSNGNGVTLVRDANWTESENVVFYDFGVSPPLWLAGPDISELAPAWHHLAFVHTGTELALWIDGTLAGSKPATDEANNTNAPVAIGTQAGTPFVPLRGVLVDELRISKGALYAEPFVPEPVLGVEGADLYWDFNEGEGDVATDLVVGLEMELDSGIDWALVD